MVQPAPQARRGLALVAMTGSLSMILLDSTILGVALPTIGRDLEFTVVSQSWAVNGYLVAMASFVALGGRIGDWIGRMRAFRLGIAGFALASVACALAPSAWVFVAARIVQGIFAATMQPASAAIVIDLYPPDRRGRAMATYAGISLLFLAAGPLVGGLLVEYQSWHWCFWLNVPVALWSLALTGSVGVKADARSRRATDWPSVAMLLVGTPLLIAGLQSVRTDFALTIASAAMAGTGGALLVLFARRQFAIDPPLIDLRLLRNRALFANASILFAFQFINVGQGIYGACYLQSSLKFTPLQAGLGTLPLLIPILAVIYFAGRLYDRRGPRLGVIIGLACACTGSMIEAIGIAMMHYPTIAIGMVFVGTGCGLAMSPMNADSLARAPSQQRGEVSGIVQTFRQFGSTIGIAMIVLVMHLAQSTPNASDTQAVAETIWTARTTSWGFGLHAVVAAGALAIAILFIRGRAPTHPRAPSTAAPDA
ncbi:MAG: MFS transporter [Phycisphaerales bacterium]|nr:MFS transporter [Phycisphaerales bacterium]